MLSVLTNHLTFNTKMGKYVIFTKDKVIGKKLFVNKEYEKEEIDLLITLLQKQNILPNNDVVIDIGSNIGYISIYLLKNNWFKKAIAIEPDPQNYYLLEKNIIMNRLENRIKALNIGLSDKIGTLSFEKSKSNFGDHRVRVDNNYNDFELKAESKRKTIKINSITFNELVNKEEIKNIGLIWIDVQGYEYYILKDIPKSIFNVTPLYVEFWPYGYKKAAVSSKQIINFYQSRFNWFYILRKSNKFVRYPIDYLPYIIEELGFGYPYYNILFTN